MPEMPRVNRVQMPLEQYVPMPDTFDFAVCYNTLFFIEKDSAVRIISRAYNSLKKGGELVFNLLGSNDGWLTDPPRQKVVGYTAEEIMRLISSFDRGSMDRKTGRFPGATGEIKYWDIWKVSVGKGSR
jgi:hypothetical protein